MRAQRIYDAHEERGDRRHERETEGIRVQGAPIEDDPGKPDEGEGDKRAEAHRRAIREDSGEQKQHPRGKNQACNHIIHGVERKGDWTAEHAHGKRAHEMPQCRIEAGTRQRGDCLVGGCHVLGDLEHGPGAGVDECPNRLHVEGVVVLLRKGIGCAERHDVDVHADGKSQGDVDAERPPVEDARPLKLQPVLTPARKTDEKRNGADHEHGEEDGHPRAEDAEFGQDDTEQTIARNAGKRRDEQRPDAADPQAQEQQEPRQVKCQHAHDDGYGKGKPHETCLSC